MASIVFIVLVSTFANVVERCAGGNNYYSDSVFFYTCIGDLCKPCGTSTVRRCTSGARLFHNSSGCILNTGCRYVEDEQRIYHFCSYGEEYESDLGFARCSGCIFGENCPIGRYSFNDSFQCFKGSACTGGVGMALSRAGNMDFYYYQVPGQGICKRCDAANCTDGAILYANARDCFRGITPAGASGILENQQRRIIMEAIDAKNVDRLEAVLQNTLDVQGTRLDDGDTVLHYAVNRQKPDFPIIWTLLQATPAMDPSVYLDGNGKSLLHHAVEADRPQMAIISIIVAHAKSINSSILNLPASNTGNTAIHTSVQRNDYRICKLLIREGVNLDVRNQFGTTPLLMAIEANGACTGPGAYSGVSKECEKELEYLDIIRMLVEHGADTNLVNAVGVGPLTASVGKLQLRTLQLLLAAGLDTRMKSSGNASVLDIAGKYLKGGSSNEANYSQQIIDVLIGNGFELPPSETRLLFFMERDGCNKKYIASLIKSGADVNVTGSDGRTPLMLAAGVRPCIELLLEWSADATAVDSFGRCVLHFAVMSTGGTDAGTMKTLIDHGANVSCKDFEEQSTPLHEVVKAQEFRSSNEIIRTTEIIKTLLNSGANVDAANALGDTSLIIACKTYQTEVADLLVRLKADVNRSNNEGDSPILAASSSAAKPHVKDPGLGLVKTLIKSGADINGKDKLHSTFMHNIANSYYFAGVTVDTMEYLLAQRPNLNALDHQLRTPLTVALQHTTLPCAPKCFIEQDLATAMTLEEFIIRLIHAGTNVNLASRDGLFPLHLAAGGIKETPLIVTALLKYNADVDVKDSRGRTPLHLAAQHGYTSTCSILLNHGANTALATTDEGFTPLMLSIKFGDGLTDTVRILANWTTHIDQWDESGYDALALAVQKGERQVAELLLEKGARLSGEYATEESSPLHTTAKSGDRHVDMLRLFLDKGSHPDTVAGGLRRTSLMAASHYRAPEAVRLLLKRGAKPLIADKNGDYALMYACRVQDNPEPVRLLLNGVSYSTAQLSNCLNLAVRSSNFIATRLLLDSGADPNYMEEDEGAVFGRSSVLQTAAEQGDYQMAALLKIRGANFQNTDATALRLRSSGTNDNYKYVAMWLHPDPYTPAAVHVDCFKTHYSTQLPLGAPPLGGRVPALNHQTLIFTPAESGDLTTDCIRYCRSKGYAFAGITQPIAKPDSTACCSISCHCESSARLLRDTPISQNCLIACPDNSSLSCGGEGAFDVYAVSTKKNAGLRCPSEWLLRGGHCYNVMEHKRNFMEAEKGCRRYGGHLASVANVHDNKLLLNLAPTEDLDDFHWIGLNDLVNEQLLEWTDGSRFRYQSFENFMINFTKTEHCVGMKAGTGDWKFLDCNLPKPFICKVLAFLPEDSYGISSGETCSTGINFVYLAIGLIVAAVLIIFLCLTPLCLGYYVCNNRFTPENGSVGEAPKRGATDAWHRGIRGMVSKCQECISVTAGVETDAKTFCEETSIQGFKEMLTAQTVISRMIWIVLFVLLITFMIVQTVEMTKTYASQETTTSVTSTLFDDDQETFKTITLCAHFHGGWARPISQGEKCFTDRGVIDLLTSYGITDDPHFTSSYTSRLSRLMSCLELSTLGELLGYLWGIQARSGTNFTSLPFLTSEMGEGGPLICRLAKSDSCSKEVGCVYTFGIDIDYATFLRTADRYHLHDSVQLYFSHYYSHDLAIASQLFQSRRSLQALPPFTISLTEDSASLSQIRYTRALDDQANVRPGNYRLPISIQATQHVLAKKKRNHCRSTPKDSVFPAWFSSVECHCEDVNNPRCISDEKKSQNYGNCSQAAMYDKDLALRFPICDLLGHDSRWRQDVPKCQMQACSDFHPRLPYCQTWSVVDNPGIHQKEESSDRGIALFLTIKLPEEKLAIDESIVMSWDQYLANLGGLWGLYIGCSFASFAHMVWFIADTVAAKKHRRSLYQLTFENQWNRVLSAVNEEKAAEPVKDTPSKRLSLNPLRKTQSDKVFKSQSLLGAALVTGSASTMGAVGMKGDKEADTTSKSEASLSSDSLKIPSEGSERIRELSKDRSLDRLVEDPKYEALAEELNAAVSRIATLERLFNDQQLGESGESNAKTDIRQ